MYHGDFTEMADMVAHISDEADIGHIKKAVCGMVDDWQTDMDHIAGMLSQEYMWRMSFPLWLRNNASQFNSSMLQRLCIFAKHLVFGRLASRHMVDSERKADHEYGNYKYMALNDRQFLGIMSSLPNGDGKTFIDIGSGIGVKPFMAWLYKGYTAYGIELNSHTYELSRFFLDSFLIENWETGACYGEDYEGSLGLTHGDAFDYTYEDYDVVYMYRPIQGREELMRLYKHVYDSMNDSAIMIEADTPSWQLKEALPTARIEGHRHSAFIYKGR